MAKKSVKVHIVEEGMNLCFENAKRFIKNAEILLDNSGSDGIAYALWSLAVEEFGKGLLMLKEIENKSPEEIVWISVSTKDHDNKFFEGFSKLVDLEGTEIGRKFRVVKNTASKPKKFTDPLDTTIAAPVQPRAIGLQESTAGTAKGVSQTVERRHKLLYVDWHPEFGKWARPGEIFNRDGIVGRWELDDDDLRIAIDSLAKQLKEIDKS